MAGNNNIEIASDLKPESEIELLPSSYSGDLVTAVPVYSIPRQIASYTTLLVTFLIPLVLTFIYLFVIASDQYVSEAQFVVRSTSSPSAESSAEIFQGKGISKSRDETYIVAEYMNSRDAMQWLIKNENLKRSFERRGIDFINSFPGLYRDNVENFYTYYKDMIYSKIDDGSGIATVKVISFAAGDSQRIAWGLIRSAEALVNRLNDRAQTDLVVQADSLVQESRRRLGRISDKLTAFRADAGLVDPSGELTSGLETITRLSTELAQLESELTRKRSMTATSPGAEPLQQKVNSLKGELAKLRAAMAGRDDSLAAKMATYDLISLEKSIAERALSSAEVNLLQARQEAQRQKLYLQTIVEPNWPDQALYPRRFLYLSASVFAWGLVFVVVIHLQRIIAEHAS